MTNEHGQLEMESGFDVDQLCAAGAAPYALLHRPNSDVRGVELIRGRAGEIEALADLPEPGAPGSEHGVLAVVPYRQVGERGFEYHNDNAPLLYLSIDRREEFGLEEVIAGIPEIALSLGKSGFDVDDAEYGEIVQKILSDCVGWGEGANFVIKRTFVAEVQDYTPAVALSVFRSLLATEQGARWTFLVRIGDRILVGASPELHVGLDGGTVSMNPISGTYRYPDGVPTESGWLEFLYDQKETDELCMVVDEELKMMARMCPDGGRVSGPYVREMSKLAHTEYLIDGETELGAREVLRETLLAPTVTGSPLENACRVIKRFEPEGRNYYSGVLALLEHDERGREKLDSAILIRTAEFEPSGRLRIGVGATLVRHSTPSTETAETTAKATALLATLRGARVSSHPGRAARGARIGDNPTIARALASRNDALASFWLADQRGENPARSELHGRRVLVIDAEDTFTSMIGVQLRSLGMRVQTRSYADEIRPQEYDLVLVGPGPGDPRDLQDAKIGALRRITRTLLEGPVPFLSVCLGHQVLCGLLDFDLIRKDEPHQGRQEVVDLFGTPHRLGFYNTFSAVSSADVHRCATIPHPIEVARNTESGEVHALRGQDFCSMQFHPESVLSSDGRAALIGLVTDLLADEPIAAH